jgi:hypothetical protein
MLLLDQSWYTTWPQECESRAEALFRAEGLTAGALIWVCHSTSARLPTWTLIQQFPHATYLERARYARNPDPELYGPGLSQFRDPDHQFHWSKRIQGQIGISFLSALRRRGFWRIRGPAVRSGRYVDGSTTWVLARHPIWGQCSALINSGDVFSGIIRATSIENLVHPWCDRPLQAFEHTAVWHRRVGRIWDLALELGS